MDVLNGWRYRALYPKAVWSLDDVGFEVEVSDKMSKMIAGVTVSLVKAHCHHLRPEILGQDKRAGLLRK